MQSVQQLWLLPPTVLVLPSDRVDVWRAELDKISAICWQQLAKTLSEDEQIRAEKFYFERDRRRFVAARGVLRSILGSYLGIRPNQVKFSYGRYGKPQLATGEIYFNVSHSEELALYAIALHRQVGIDIEFQRPMPDAEKLAQRFFSASEFAELSALPAAEKQVAFFRYWTCKEAYLKALGTGLSQSLQTTNISLLADKPVLFRTSSAIPDSDWFLEELTPAFNYTAALVVQGNQCLIGYWHWSENTSN
jgi:4'-phosphopantetheinyl transferase